MSTADANTLPERGPGVRAKASVGQWTTLEKQAVATIHTEPDACEDCKPLDGDTMRMGEAEDTLPKHPNCRCWYTWDWRPGMRSLPMTALLTCASEHSDSTMHDTLTKTTSTTDASIVKGTPTGEKDDDAEYIRVPISSTNTDRDGDRFSEGGLEDLRDQIRETSKPVFENHGIGEGGLFGVRYDWKGIIGSQDDAEIETDGDEKTLHSFVRPNAESEEGQLFRSYVEAGMPVGLSIGFRALEFESNDDDEKTFHETDLLETSAVGIQSNRESVAGRDSPTVEAVAKGVVARFDGADLDEDTLANAIVSEASAADGSGLPARDLTHDQREQRDHNNETHQNPNMDDDTKELLERQTAILENEQQKRNELEARVDALEADDGGGDGDGGTEKEGGEGEGDPGGDDDPDDVDELRSEIGELRDMVDEEDDTEGSETTTAAKNPGGEGGDDTGGGDDTEKDTIAAEDGGWM